MLAAANKYRQAFLLGLQSNIVYRWNFAVRSAFSIINLVVVFVLWGAAYAGAPGMGGFGFGQTFTYFTVVLVLHFLIGAFNEDYQISDDIRNGLINQFLLKPINYFAYRLSIFSAARLVSGALALVPMLILVPFLRHLLVFPHEGWRLLLGAPALALSALIQFTIAYCFGMLSFWLLEIQGFVILSLAIESMLGGQMFPLDLMSAGLFRAAHWLPFYYEMYFPAAILTGRLGRADVWPQLGLEAGWALLLLALAHLLWARGLRRYTAVGV